MRENITKVNNDNSNYMKAIKKNLKINSEQFLLSEELDFLRKTFIVYTGNVIGGISYYSDVKENWKLIIIFHFFQLSDTYITFCFLPIFERE